MKWSAPAAAAFLALGYVHYAAVVELGGNPALVVVWLVLFLFAAAVATKHTLDWRVPQPVRVVKFPRNPRRR